MAYNESRRLFSDCFEGCIGIAYIALHANNARTAHLRHAYPFQVAKGVELSRPHQPPPIIEAVGVLMVYTPTVQLFDPFGIDGPPPQGYSIPPQITALAENMADICGKETFIVPYSLSNTAHYAGTLVVDMASHDQLGAIIVDGRFQFGSR